MSKTFTVRLPPLKGQDNFNFKETIIDGFPLACFSSGGEKRVCYTELVNKVLKDFDSKEIDANRDRLQIYCPRCSPQQLELFKLAGVLPWSKETELPKPTQTQCEGCRKKFQEGCCRRKRSTTWWKIVVWKKSEIYQLLAWNIDYGSTHWIITDSRALPLLGKTKVESCVSKRKPNLRLWSRECGSCYTTAFYWRFPFVRTGQPDHCRIHRVFAEKPPLSCILFRIWLIWLDSFH